MSQLPCLSVSDFNHTIKHLLENELALNDVLIQGELSNIKHYRQGGQIYFTLSDAGASVSGFFYATMLERLDFTPENGTKVLVRGQIRFFQKRGQFMLQANFMALEGKGQLSQAFEQLKAKLHNEGLFDAARKKPIPAYPDHLVLITSYNSAAMWDFLTIAHQEAPHLNITIIPAVMQGFSAPKSIMTALDIAESRRDVDAIMLMRGGGSAEDLLCFNYENLIRRIADLSLPLVSAIGHEIDYTLCDFVSDLRCPTPTAAAQVMTSNFAGLRRWLPDQLSGVQQQVQQRLSNANENLINSHETAFSLISERQKSIFEHYARLTQRLFHANPLQKLKQGFSITRRQATGEILKSESMVSEGESITVQFSQGSLHAKVTHYDAGNTIN